MRVVVMGVTGCGKSTVGSAIAAALGVDFCDGDDLHSEANVAKMAASIPLTDEDRWPWLADVGAWLGARGAGVIACSALRRAYRDVIRAAAPDTVFVHLEAPQVVLEERVRARAVATGHFAGPGLLDSQYATLEPLAPDEPGIAIDVATTNATDAASAALHALAARDAED